MNKIEMQLDDAINRANLLEVKSLVEKGARIEYRDALGWTALMSAAWVASLEIVEYLVEEKGVNIYAINNEKQTALDMIQSIGHNEYGHDIVIEYLKAKMNSSSSRM